MKPFIRRSALLLPLLAAALSARAATLVFAGDTTGKPKLRLFDFIDPAPYARFDFKVGAPGRHAFSCKSGFDNYGLLYFAGTFDPDRPWDNLLAFNDDGVPGDSNSSFDCDLQANVDYTYVITGFDETQFGAFRATISSDAAPAVPGPAAAAPFALLALRRRKRA